MNVQQFFENGYYFGRISEFIDDLDQFNEKWKYISNISLNDENYWDCQYVAESNESNQDMLWPHTISLKDKPKRQKFIEENNIVYMSRSNTIKDRHDITEILNYFLIKATSYLEKIYGSKYTSYHHSIHCYTEGDKLNPHTDNHNAADCALVIYFSPNDWNNNGGVLKICGTEHQCFPVTGNFSLLDLTKNNLRHEITEVTGTFKRYSYLLFARKAIQ